MKPFRAFPRGTAAALAVVLAAALLLPKTSRAQKPGIRVAWDYATRTEISESGNYARMMRLGDSDTLLATYVHAPGPTDVAVQRSFDGGRTWGARIHATRGLRPETTQNNPELFQLDNGNVLLAYGMRPKEDSTGTPFSLSVSVSRDSGRTWTHRATVYEAGPSNENGVWEPIIRKLPSGRLQLYAANEAPYDRSDDQEISMWTSTDRGRTWSEDFVTASYRHGSRDGMPVPVLLENGGGENGGGIAYIIEDPGWPGCGGFKPTIIWTPSVEDAWAEAPIRAGSDQRWRAMEPSERVPCGVYAGMPYLVQFPQGETVVAVHPEWGPGGRRRDRPNMMTAVGDAEAKHFSRRSWPLDVPADKETSWGSLTVKDSSTVTAITSYGFRGPVVAIDGHRIPEPVAYEAGRPLDVDGQLDEDAWAGAHETFVGARSLTRGWFRPLWHGDALYLSCEVENARLGKAARSRAPACLFELYGPQGETSYRVAAGPGVNARFQQRPAASAASWRAWDRPRGAAVSVARADDGEGRYAVEVRLPWVALGGQPALGQGWGVNYGLRRMGEEDTARIEYVSGNDPDRPAETWQRMTRSEEPPGEGPPR